LTEVTDALAVVVSEKSGVISLAENGYLTRFLTKDLLEEKLLSLYKTESVKNGGLFKWRKQKAAS
jgi:diadenylate cyclase